MLTDTGAIVMSKTRLRCKVMSGSLAYLQPSFVLLSVAPNTMERNADARDLASS